MIKLIADAIEPRITGCLPFVDTERYGGLIIPVVRQIPIETEDNEGNVRTTFIDQYFPVSCSMEGECWEDEKYKKLIPDQSYKSVSYLEQIGDADIVLDAPKNNELTATYRIRFVCWLNLAKLGIIDCLGTHLFELYTIQQLKGRGVFSITPDALSQAANVTLRNFRIIRRDPVAIFGRYYYAIKQAAFFYPFDFFAIEFDAQVKLGLGCVQPLVIGEPIECMTEW